VSAPWWAALCPAQSRISCGTGKHLIRWADGQLTAADHADAEGELVLAALGGDKSECGDAVFAGFISRLHDGLFLNEAITG